RRGLQNLWILNSQKPPAHLAYSWAPTWAVNAMRKSLITLAALVVFVTLGIAVPPPAAGQTPAQQSSAPRSKAKAVGAIKSISGNAVTVTTDAGAEVIVVIQPSTWLVRIASGQSGLKDLKTAEPIQLQEVEVGDRLAALGTASDDGKSVTATSVVVMKKADIAAKLERDRQDWQKRGVGGVVKSIDAATGTITLSTGGLNASSTLAVVVSKDTMLRRYAPDSVKFDDAKPGTLDQIKPGDQLRARGTKSADGKELAAEEVVSGTFRNVAGTVVATDAGNGTVTLQDLVTKRPVTMKITNESQLRKLPPMMAQRIAMRLKGGAPNGPAGAANAAAPPAPARAGAVPEGSGGVGFRQGGAPDFQKMLNRMPAVTLADVQKGEALMIVATEGSAEVPSTAIILLSGVEPILTAAPSQASTILSPWNLSGGGNVGTGDAP